MTTQSQVLDTFLAATPTHRRKIVNADNAIALALELGVLVDQLKFQVRETTGSYEQLLAGSERDCDNFNIALNARDDVIRETKERFAEAEEKIAHLLAYILQCKRVEHELAQARNIETNLAGLGVVLFP